MNHSNRSLTRGNVKHCPPVPPILPPVVAPILIVNELPPESSAPPPFKRAKMSHTTSIRNGFNNHNPFTNGGNNFDMR